ncbi:unnamed protein product [Larinioides sclopetarius]|uniref:unspecific monooxygenase n=1 Tax=Larinioides sclopetarius TaxID=280406 RepID=A0AAV1YYD6_9ARAC
MTVLRNRGSMLGEKIVITTVYDSIKSIVNDLRQEMGKPVNLIQFLTHKCTANIRLMLFGEVGASEEQIQRITKLHAEELGAMTPLNLLLSGPLARYLIFPSQPAFCKALKCHREMERILFDIVKDHKDTYDKENARDIIDDYFAERDLRQSKGDVTAKYFSDFCLVQTLTQFVSEGVLAIALTINILIKFIIEKPEEQEKIYQEIMEVVGLDRQPTIEDRSKLTYLNAFIYEGMRASSVFSIFPSWECTKTTLNGYRIPKGAVTLINFHSCKNDPEVYEKPEKFNPSRFIPTEEKRSAELPIVFGVGKRSCLGEGFALTQIFLFLATILQNFELKFPDDTNLSSRQVYMTRNLLVCARPRSYI